MKKKTPFKAEVMEQIKEDSRKRAEELLAEQNRYYNSKEYKDRVIDDIQSDLTILLELNKVADYESEEAIAIEEEFKKKIEENSTFDEFKMYGSLDSLFCRCWLVGYKGRGYILTDGGNSNWGYLCNVREAMFRIATKDFGSEYIQY